MRLFTSIASRQWNIIQCCGIIHLFPALSLWHCIDPLKLPMEGVCTPRSQEILQTRAFVPGSQLASLCCSHCHVWLFGNPLDYNLPRSSVHRIFQARVLELIPTSFSRGFSRPRDQTHVSSTGRQILYPWGTREAMSTIHWPTSVWSATPMQELLILYLFRRTFSLAYFCHVMIWRSCLYLSLLLQGKLFFSSNTLMGQTNFRRSQQN